MRSIRQRSAGRQPCPVVPVSLALLTCRGDSLAGDRRPAIREVMRSPGMSGKTPPLGDGAGGSEIMEAGNSR
ncbi:hypothetical protein [Azospirillum endophyticum]